MSITTTKQDYKMKIPTMTNAFIRQLMKTIEQRNNQLDKLQIYTLNSINKLKH